MKERSFIPVASCFFRFCGFSSNWILPYFPSLRPSVCSCVPGVTSHISHIYKGINAMLIIRGPIKPYIFWIKITLAIFLAKTRPDIDFDFKLSKVWMLNPHCLLCLVFIIIWSLFIVFISITTVVEVMCSSHLYLEGSVAGEQPRLLTDLPFEVSANVIYISYNAIFHFDLDDFDWLLGKNR